MAAAPLVGNQDPKAVSVMQDFSSIEQDRGTFESVWDEIGTYVVARGDFTAEDSTQGRKRHTRIYDNTGLLAAELLASGLHSLLTNTSTRWFKLAFQFQQLNEFHPAKVWLEAVEEVLFSTFNSPKSRFSSQIHEVYQDVVDFGTGCLFVEDRPGDDILFTAIPLQEVYLKEDSAGRVDTVFRKTRMTARQVVEEFGKGAMPRADIAVEKGNSGEGFDILHVVRPRRDPPGVMGPVNTKMPFEEIYVNPKDLQIIRERGFFTFPYMISRWRKHAGETYGRGPGHDALPDQKMLNEIQKTLIKAAQKATDPPLLVNDDGVLGGSIITTPGGVTSVRENMDSNVDPVRPLDASRLGIPIGIEMVERTRSNVRAAFHFELLQLIQHTPGTTPITATQTSAIAQNTMRVLSPILQRQHVELLSPMIDRTFDILERRGDLPGAPAEIEDLDIEIEYLSPVARAQRSGEARALVESMEIAGNLGQIDPDVIKTVDFEEGIRSVFDFLGVQAKNLRSRIDVETMKEAERQLAAQQARLDQAEQAAGVAEKASRASSG